MQQTKSYQLAQNANAETGVQGDEKEDELDGPSLLLCTMEEEVEKQGTMEATEEGNSKSEHICLHIHVIPPNFCVATEHVLNALL